MLCRSIRDSALTSSRLRAVLVPFNLYHVSSPVDHAE
jgi:hypothetical protein